MLRRHTGKQTMAFIMVDIESDGPMIANLNVTPDPNVFFKIIQKIVHTWQGII